MNQDVLASLIQRASEGFAKGLMHGCLNELGNGPSSSPNGDAPSPSPNMAAHRLLDASEDFSPSEDFAPNEVGLVLPDPEEANGAPAIHRILKTLRDGAPPGHFSPRATRHEMQPWMEQEAPEADDD